MKKTKLLMPILGISSIGLVAIPLSSCSCTPPAQDDYNIELEYYNKGGLKGYYLKGADPEKEETFGKTLKKGGEYTITVSLVSLEEKTSSLCFLYNGIEQSTKAEVIKNATVTLDGNNVEISKISETYEYTEGTIAATVEWNPIAQKTTGTLKIKFTYDGVDNIKWTIAIVPGAA